MWSSCSGVDMQEPPLLPPPSVCFVVQSAVLEEHLFHLGLQAQQAIHVIQDHHRLSNHLLHLGLQLGIAGKMGPLTVHAIKGWVSRDVSPIW